MLFHNKFNENVFIFNKSLVTNIVCAKKSSKKKNTGGSVGFEFLIILFLLNSSFLASIDCVKISH